MSKCRTRKLWLIAIAALLGAADPPWISRQPSQWTEEDAKLVLTTSPWVREIRAGVARRLTEEELRQAGEMGQRQGVGYDGIDPKGSGPKASPKIFTNGEDRSPRSLPGTLTLRLRWESALPVRVAELRAREGDLPVLEGDGYRIAVYGVPGTNFRGDPIELGEPLKKDAALKRAGKKDVKPLRVEVFQRDDGLLVAYLFPLSAEITKKDGRIDFEAHIGRINVSQSFDLAGMMLQGKLEL